MKDLKYGFRMAIIVFIFSGCTNKYAVTFDSNPRGASLVCNGTNFGYTPKTLYYDEKVRNYSYLDVSSCSANWVSGYSASYPRDMTIFASGGSITTLDRPTYGEGYPIDAQFALQIEQANVQQRQAQASERANNQRALQNLNNSLNQMNQQNQNIYNDAIINNNQQDSDKKYYYMHQMAPNLFYVK